ncbi:hypothetical protein BS47DRAFT_1358270 [Hydnum rufescens UP504]|uniref:Uncharacterized protein n=1 Tax=Hydnum rufescens UP504 TaxID=1448309 RepID=A0A9P6E207_9AGAM|nr:hypothetical protein BS47DRAFT_1358270 [Hydnum rufescens UP504]
MWSDIMQLHPQMGLSPWHGLPHLKPWGSQDTSNRAPRDTVLSHWDHTTANSGHEALPIEARHSYDNNPRLIWVNHQIGIGIKDDIGEKASVYINPLEGLTSETISGDTIISNYKYLHKSQPSRVAGNLLEGSDRTVILSSSDYKMRLLSSLRPDTSDIRLPQYCRSSIITMEENKT